MQGCDGRWPCLHLILFSNILQKSGFCSLETDLPADPCKQNLTNFNNLALVSYK